VEEGRLVGLLTQSDLMQGISDRGEESMTVHSMRRDLALTDPEEPLESAFQSLQEAGQTVMPVIATGGRLAGLLTLDNVRELLMLHRARQR
jgi:stage IV sporulation protein FB